MFTAIINTPGYLSEQDEIPTFDTAREAWDYLADEREREEEQEAFGHECDDLGCDWRPEADFTEAVAQMREHSDECGFVYADTVGSHSEHDLGKMYKVDVVED